MRKPSQRLAKKLKAIEASLDAFDSGQQGSPVMYLGKTYSTPDDLDWLRRFVGVEDQIEQITGGFQSFSLENHSGERPDFEKLKAQRLALLNERSNKQRGGIRVRNVVPQT